MTHTEYLISYGCLGDFGRFRPLRPLACARGDRVVVASHRGLEIGEVLREATAGHAQFLPNTTVGQLLRPAGPEDDATADRMATRALAVLERGRLVAVELGLPLELIDVEMLLDGRHAILHNLRAEACDVRPFVSTLAREFDVEVALADLTGPALGPAPEEDPGCGKCSDGGGCGSCSTGGCGSCATKKAPNPFRDLRDQMDRRRSPLL